MHELEKETRWKEHDWRLCRNVFFYFRPSSLSPSGCWEEVSLAAQREEYLKKVYTDANKGEKGVQIKKARQQEVPQNKYAGCKGRCFIFQSWPLCAVRRKKL